MRTRISVLLAALVFSSLTLMAADEPPSTSFNAKIDSWIEGAVMSIDADAGKFSVRGTRRAYASTYASMLHEIETKTATLDAEARAKRTAEIRASYKEKLAAAHDAENKRESDFVFYLPTKTSRLVVVNESQFYGLPVKDDDAPAEINGTEAEKRALSDLKSMKVGEHVVVGFDGGVIYNSAYAVIKIPGGPIPAAFTTEEKAIVDEPKIASNDLAAPSKADLETTKLIKDSIAADKSLSEIARSVQVSTLKGHVTLRGTVKSDDEKRIVFNKAALQVGETKVTNEIEIK